LGQKYWHFHEQLVAFN